MPIVFPLPRERFYQIVDVLREQFIKEGCEDDLDALTLTLQESVTRLEELTVRTGIPWGDLTFFFLEILQIMGKFPSEPMDKTRRDEVFHILQDLFVQEGCSSVDQISKAFLDGTWRMPELSRITCISIEELTVFFMELFVTRSD